MNSILVIWVIVIAYLKIYLGISKLLNFKFPFNKLNILIVPILIFEILSILLFIIWPNLYMFSPAIIHFVGNSLKIFHFNLFAIVYILINTLLIITTIGLNDYFKPIYNLVLAIHFILSALFTLRV